MNIPSGLGDALLNSASDAVIATDSEGRIIFWNPGAERIFGFSADEAVRRSLDLIIPENLRARHWCRLSPHDGDRNQQLRPRRSVVGAGIDQGRPARLRQFTIVMLRNEQQQVTGTVAVMRNVTKRFEEVREMRRELRKSVEPERDHDFAGGSHGVGKCGHNAENQHRRDNVGCRAEAECERRCGRNGGEDPEGKSCISKLATPVAEKCGAFFHRLRV